VIIAPHKYENQGRVSRSISEQFSECILSDGIEYIVDCSAISSQLIAVKRKSKIFVGVGEKKAIFYE
jgi:hypothetical protein